MRARLAALEIHFIPPLQRGTGPNSYVIFYFCGPTASGIFFAASLQLSLDAIRVPGPAFSFALLIATIAGYLFCQRSNVGSKYAFLRLIAPRKLPAKQVVEKRLLPMSKKDARYNAKWPGNHKQ